MKLKYFFSSIVLLITLASPLFPQNKIENDSTFKVILNYSETNVLYSESVEDSFYIYVKLPKDYLNNSNKKYPGIFLLDGDIAFPMAWSIVRYLQYGQYVPDAIIVGIGYGGLFSSDKPNHRERDYSISTIERIKGSGGGDRFLAFIKNELLPFIGSKYRMDSSNLTLSGHSLGGLFVLYSFLSEPGLFSNYIASSPYTTLDINKLISFEEKNINKIKDSKCHLFVSIGANEDSLEYLRPVSRIINGLIDSGFYKENINFKIFGEGVHFSTPAEALTYGLIFSFKQ